MFDPARGPDYMDTMESCLKLKKKSPVPTFSQLNPNLYLILSRVIVQRNSDSDAQPRLRTSIQKNDYVKIAISEEILSRLWIRKRQAKQQNQVEGLEELGDNRVSTQINSVLWLRLAGV